MTLTTNLHSSSTKPVQSHSNIGPYLRLSMYFGLLLLLLPAHVAAQNVQYNNKSMDLGLRGTRKVNPSTRGMELQIPLGHYRGRGVDVPITLSYSSKLWMVSFQGYNVGAPPPHQPAPFTIVTADYAKHSVRGWTSTIGFPVIDLAPGNQVYDQFGAPNVSGNCTFGCYLVDRLYVWLPDGSGHEMRASDQPRQTGTTAPDEYYAVDGSRMRYQKSTQTLFMPDGSRYLFTTGKFIDRNGNTVSNSGGGWTDTLGRQINNPLPYNTGSGPFTPTDQSYSLPGVGATTLNYTFKWRYLADVLSTPQTLRYTADWGCPPGMGSSYSPNLFSSDSGNRTCMGNAGVLHNPVVLWQIVLPNGQNYTFSYDIYGTIEKVVLPTGGYEKFEHGAVSTLSSPLTYKWVYGQANRGVLRHIISPTGLAADEVQWVYNGTSNSTTVTAPDGSRIERYMWVDGTASWTYSTDGARAGQTFDERVYAPSGQMVRRKMTDWAMTASNAGSFPSGANIATRNARVAREVEFLLDTGGPALAKSRTYGYDLTYQWTVGAEQTVTNEFAFVDVDVNTAQTIAIGSLSSIPNGTLLRTTETDYLTTDANYRSRNILGTPTATRVKNGAGTIVAQSVISYDEGAFPLLTYPSVNAWTDPATQYRANPTTVTSWLNFNGTTLSSFPAGTYLATHTQYDQCGSVRKLWKASDTSLTNPTLTDYSDTYHRAYPTSETTSDPDGAGPLTALTSSTEYDFSTGLETATVDQNSQRTTFSYNDPLNRLKQVSSADTDPAARTQTTYTYDDIARTITTTTDLTSYNDNVLKTVVVHDGLGRQQEKRKYETVSSFITIQTQYDNMGRAFKTSNPYRQGDTIVWTTQAFDALGRVTSLTTPDNAVVTTTYSTNSQTITDQAGKAKKLVLDSLERLVEVYEDPAGLNYQTTYTYDTLDNMVKVTQGSQQRFFMFDSLKRMIRSRNPEHITNPNLNLSDPLTANSTWSMSYQYDSNGNLTQKKDPRNVQTSYIYDALNRNTNVDYSDATPDVVRSYDTATNGKGRLSQVLQSGATTSASYVDAYDALGRPTIHRQRFQTAGVWSDSYQILRTYNRAGGVTSQTYPSGRVVTYAYDGAGRASSFIGNLGDGVSRNYATGIEYSVWNSISREQFGTQTPLYHKRLYNIRGQMFDTRVSSVNDLWDWNRGRFILYYSSNHLWAQSGTDNNGNVRFAETWIPPENAQLDQAQMLIEHAYNYDGVNRLTSVAEQKLEMPAWVWQSQFQQAYTYDRYGNRTINAAQTWGTGINAKQFTVDAAMNRLGVPAGQSGVMTYDNAGNLLTDSYSGAGGRTYDAENKMTTAADGTGQTSRYSYNADGKRVRRQVASGQEMWLVYGMDNELVAEYRASVAPTGPEKEFGYRNGQLLVTATGRINVALAANGAVGTASTTATTSGFSTTGAMNGNFRGPWGNWVEGWNDNTPNVVPDWIEIAFAGSKTIDEINVFGLHDNYTVENTPTLSQTFTLYGLIAFNVQYWNGSSWVTVTGGAVTGNNKVWRQFTFSPVTTSKIRVFINQVPDAWSRVVEIQAFGTSAGGEKVQWLVPDQLGSPRMVIDSTGTLAGVKRHDYLPFGEELFAGTGGRTATLGYYGVDGVRQQFTQKERDIETGLDYFEARYYSSVQGRFTSPDEFTGGAVELFQFTAAAASNPTFYSDLSNPQSLNKYGFCSNNPLRFIDPSGHKFFYVFVSGVVGNPLGHAALKYVNDKTGEVTYYDIYGSTFGDKWVQKNTQQEFDARFKDRGYEEVEVDVPNEQDALNYIYEASKQPWEFNFVTNNCNNFVIYTLEKGGAKILSDGSRGENPRKYPRDARDGFKKQQEEKKKQQEQQKQQNKLSVWPLEEIHRLMLAELAQRLEDAEIKRILTSYQPR